VRFLYTLAGLACGAAAAWLPPRHPGVQLIAEKPGSWKTVSTLSGEYTLESAQQYPAQAGGSFQVDLSIRVGLDTRALPELACYDSAGREIPVASSLSTGPDFSTTNWQRLRRVFPVQPGTATVRARVRASGRGEVQMADLEFRPRKIEAYQTGALIGQLYPNRRRGLVLESNRGIVNSERVTELDRDGDNRWALVSVDLDEISQPEQAGEDWRTRFEYRPNEIYWSDGAVLKSDSVLHDREPDIGRALHFRTRVFPSAYRAILNDPGRAVAIRIAR